MVSLLMLFASFCEETKRKEAVRKDSGTPDSNPDAAAPRSIKSSFRGGKWCR
jgi:hypothetical protein